MSPTQSVPKPHDSKPPEAIGRGSLEPLPVIRPFPERRVDRPLNGTNGNGRARPHAIGRKPARHVGARRLDAGSIARRIIRIWGARKQRSVWLVVEDREGPLLPAAQEVGRRLGRIERTLTLEQACTLAAASAAAKAGGHAAPNRRQPPSPRPSPPRPIDGPTSGWPRALVLATSESKPARLVENLVALRAMGSAVYLIAPITSRLDLGRRVARAPGIRFLAIPSPRRRYAPPVKRAVDMTLTPVALLAVLPVMALLALVVRLTSRGPALFRQVRLGKDARPFTFLKFRTMVNGNDDRTHREYLSRFIAGQTQAEPSAHDSQQVFKLTNDRRITRPGHIMRRLSLDELPQLFNVLAGTMSLVGPRPPLPYEAAQYQDWHRLRFESEAGLTGFWQVYGRSRVTFDDAVLLDILYTMCRSPWLDIRLIARTVPAALSGRGGL